MAYAQDQAFPGYCGPASIAMILTEVYGRPIDDAAVAEDVNNAGLLIFNASGAVVGMTDTAIVTMLDAYGVAAHSEQGDLDELRVYLDEGREIILAVDSSEVWGWQENGLDISDNPGAATADKSDHFLVITEINDATGMVTLNDPGLGEAYGFAAGTGHGYQVPIALLEDAWADSGNVMIVTDGMTADAAVGSSLSTGEGPTSPMSADLAATPPPAGLVLLPATVAIALLRSLRRES